MRGFSKPLLTLIIAAATVSTVFAAPPTQPEAPRAELRRDGHFANLFRFEFKPGKSDEAITILKSTLLPAYRKAGIKAELIEDLLGTKDVYLIVPIQSGPNYYAYEVPPEDADAWRALMQLAGGATEGEKRMDDFIGYVVRQSQSLVFIAD